MKATANASTSVWERTLPGSLYLLIFAGLILRLLFIGNQGFSVDIRTFEAWAISLVQNGPGLFYSKTSFADYPPGYFYILWGVGEFWHGLFQAHDASYGIIATLVKLPAIFADLLVGWLIFAIGSRIGNRTLAFAAAALYLLNPAVIFISAAWGQVDSIAGGLALLSAYFFLRASGEDGVVQSSRSQITWIVGAWLVMTYSLLIKPQAAVLIPLFIAFAFVNKTMRRDRLFATGLGIVSSFLLALLLSLPFHAGNPVAVFSWLFHQYQFGSSVYSYNSVNAFNLWAIKGVMWMPDTDAIAYLPQYIWGIALVLGALALIIWRYLQDGSMRSFFEASAIALLAFFMLSTRMHERYLFDGLLFTIVCLPIAARYMWASLAFTATLFLNLMYSMQYLSAMTATPAVPGLDAHNLWGLGTQALALISVGVFFGIGYLFLGAPVAEPVALDTRKKGASSPAAWDGGSIDYIVSKLPPAKRWFDPHEGLQSLSAPLDYIIMCVLGIGNFVLSFVGYWYPPDQIFDEVYFGRAATEYLQNIRIYENTHPPLTKLLITLSVMLFGGMPAGHGIHTGGILNHILGHMTDGNNSYGWRFLDVVFGAFVVVLIYAFAKRLTGSTIFATVAGLLLTFDGMHFVQSRIGTPEGFVVFFALFAVYAFYRFLIASQTSVRKNMNVPPVAYAVGIGGSFAVGLLVASLFGLVPWAYSWMPGVTEHQLQALFIAMLPTFYITSAVYLIVTYAVFPRLFADGLTEETFGEGSYLLRDASGEATFYTADGGTFNTKTKQIVRGDVSQSRGGELVYNDGDVTIAYHADGSVDYTSPSGSAKYIDNETRAGGAVEKGSSAKLWLIVFTIMLGLLVSSKWYGVMGFGVSFIALIGLWVQRLALHRRPSLWGNPRGFRLDRALATIAFVAMTVYASVWIPDLMRHGKDDIQNMSDVVYRQYTMYSYHDDLRATHPYSSKWWEWPLDYVPVAYYYHDERKDQTIDKECCVYEVTTMPNPFILWTGLIFVPFVGFLAYRERNKGYALLILTYLMQWVPWALSPRIAWEYHFYVDIPIICLCNTIALQRVWQWARDRGPDGRWIGIFAVGGYVAAIGLVFVFFYPILAAHGITHAEWQQRMWFSKWIIGPG